MKKNGNHVMITIQAENIKNGNRIDIEGDFYLDPNMDRSEYGTVQSDPKNYNGFILMNVDGTDYVFPGNYIFHVIKE